MNARILALQPAGRGQRLVTFFGYSSRGLPGLEVAGLGPAGRVIKEKLLYLGRRYKMQTPLRRYLICAENYLPKQPNPQDIPWLELPILLLYHNLCGRLPVGRLEDCFCGGRVSAAGGIRHLPPQTELLERLERYLALRERRLVHLAPKDFPCGERINVIPLEELVAPLRVMPPSPFFPLPAKKP